MDLSYELDENESNELLNMCLGTAPLWTFQNKTNTENPEINEQEFVKQMRNDNTVRKTKTVISKSVLNGAVPSNVKRMID